jgi:hypothetical protein
VRVGGDRAVVFPISWPTAIAIEWPRWLIQRAGIRAALVNYAVDSARNLYSLTGDIESWDALRTSASLTRVDSANRIRYLLLRRQAKGERLEQFDT